MSLSEAYIRKIEYLIENLSKRLYQPVSECTFDAFFTFDRLSLNDAKQHKKKKFFPKHLGGKSGNTDGFLQL